MSKVKRGCDGAKLRPYKELIIALNDLDFSWYPEEVKAAAEMWEKQEPIWEISKKLKRDIDEVAVLIMHLRRQRKIKIRPGGVLG